MKLTVQQHPNDSGFITPWSAVFEAPGGTVGRSADNRLILPDPERGICRIQAALRISNDACYLVNLSSMSSVSINGRAIQRDQEVPLSPGDELVIGSYTLRAEDPLAPAAENAAASPGGFATLSAVAPDPLLAEPDPLLESPLLDPAAITPKSAAPRENPTPISRVTSAPASPPPPTSAPGVIAAATATMSAAAEVAAPLVTAKPEPGTAPQSESANSSDTSTNTSPTADIPNTTAPAAETAAAAQFTEDVPPQSTVEPVAPPAPAKDFAAASATDAFAPAAPADNPSAAEESLFDEPFAATSSADNSSTDVFSDLFGPGTLPVGSVPDVSAHPFDMESAQTRNPEDPLRHLPRGDANVSGPLRDPLDLLDSHEGEGVHNVFSDQTPSTLPSHDPLAPHRLDPVSEALRSTQDHDNQGWAARDHLREYGGYLRPARVQRPAPTSDDTDSEPDTPRRK
ncbi:FHA domain-containing protein [Bordetella genomosp. 4]|uniref:FHA domain-containing protein n=1 Tax=Bordetella genomosp. 4 TaxID=463044 RepID=A0A261TMW0_9BORD|nr:FHA domain-containing protein [Bordetella genomosp. 4]OZI50597.1 hypothetical protein CAL20_22390 [Bordetella genomosp. 4]